MRYIITFMTSVSEKTNAHSAKAMILMAAMSLIGLATAGFQNGLHMEDVAEFISGLILIAIYHFWFAKDIHGICTRDKKVFDERISMVEKRLEALKESDTAMVEKRL